MKKISLLLLLVVVLSGCSLSPDSKDNMENMQNNGALTSPDLKLNCLTIGTGQNQVLNLKAKVVSSNVKNIVSNNAGIITYLNCEQGQKVDAKTLVAKISPDWTDPNVKNLLNQKKSLENQITNLLNIIQATKNNFSSQLNSLNIQKKNTEKQIASLQTSLENLKKQKSYGLGDLQTQIKTLEKTLTDLEKSKQKLEQSKQAEISKLQASIENTKQQAKSLIKTILLKIDEIYGISNENKHKNDAFENYLSAKNTALKEIIKGDWQKLNNFSGSMLDYLQKTDDLVNIVKQSIQASVVAPTLPQSVIDVWYNLFNQYDTSLINLKNSLENLLKSKETIENNYDNQILNLQTQINTTKNNIENLKANKIGSYTSSIDIQISQTQTQLDSAKSSLKSINNQIQSLKDQENIQIKQLENQLSQLKSSLNSININLSTQNIYAGVNGKVKLKKVSKGNKVGPGTLLCQIIPQKSSLKLQVMMGISDDFLENHQMINRYVEFENNGKKCRVKIVSKLPYKDPITQNSIYETEALPTNCELPENTILSVLVKISSKKTNNEVKIPLDFVINKITGQKVKVYSGNKIIEKNIKLGNIDGAMVEVLSGLKVGDRICR